LSSQKIKSTVLILLFNQWALLLHQRLQAWMLFSHKNTFVILWIFWTIQIVFKEHALPCGTWVSRGRKIDPSRITRTALLTLEGELDDISGVGQTEAAQKLCSSLPKSMKKHHLQKGVGHYGIFNGRKFREHVVPVIVDFAEKNQQPAKH
jgi:polyhydroxyalkanoate depolymerase